MSQASVQTLEAVEQEPLAEHVPHNRKHYAELVDKYFKYAHSNRLERISGR